MRKTIYMDNAATTAVRPEVLAKMLPYFTERYGNPSSIHGTGREASKAVERARKQVADAIGAQPGEIFFTSGGSESDTWAIRCASQKGKHIITSKIEHHAVLHACAAMEKQGYEVTYLPVDGDGLIDPEDVKKALRPDTALVSIMTANNEIGTLEPIAQVGEIVQAAGVPFHTDAVQAAGAIPLDCSALHVDMLSLSAHKFHGPKGVGALYVRKGTKLGRLIYGGAQERGLRAGTENGPAIVGMGEALSLAANELPSAAKRVLALRERLINGLLREIPECRLNGHRTLRLPGNVNVSLRHIEAKALLACLDLVGIACSSGSACTSGSLDTSHVLLAIGLPDEIARGSLRLSLGAENTAEEVDAVLRVLPGIVRELRSRNTVESSPEKQEDAVCAANTQ